MCNELPSSSQGLNRKPQFSAFKQQKLPAWQPILNAGNVLPTFFIIGIIFTPIGVGIIWASNNVQEKYIEYVDCKSKTNSSLSCADFIGNARDKSCSCSVKFTLDEDFQGDIYIYYELQNFYQNHRRYVKSRDDRQLLGKFDQELDDSCEPYKNDPKTGKPIAPCGAIANSMFSDEFYLMSLTSGARIPVPLIRTGIAWPSDKNIKFRNPPGGNLRKAFENFAKPVDWQKNIWELDLTDESNNGFQNEDFIVWMRTAALPNFRKLYRHLNRSVDPFTSGLKRGKYELEVKYNYPVKGFGGHKRLIISTTSILGAKNPFLGYAYIVSSSLCLIVGISFLIIHLKYGKSTSTTELVNTTPTTSF